MYQMSYRHHTYRMVSPVKFIISAIIIITLLFAIGLGIFTVVKNLYTTYYVIPNLEKTAPVAEVIIPTYIYSKNDITITTTDKDEYIQELEDSLTDVSNRETDIESKYNDAVQQKNGITKKDVSLYNEFKYVLTAPKSDFTIEDLEMTSEKCEKNDLNPHLWYAVVQLESSYYSNPKMPRTSTARGWGQVLRGTGRWIYEDKLKLGKYDHNSMGANKDINSTISIYYLSTLIHENGVRTGLLRYNGGELGQRYVDIVAANLKKNTGLTLNDVAPK